MRWGHIGSTRLGLTHQFLTSRFCIYLIVFEWDVWKASENMRKHGVSFDEAATSFADEHALDGPDVKHSGQESRFLRLGRSAMNRVLVVA